MLNSDNLSRAALVALLTFSLAGGSVLTQWLKGATLATLPYTLAPAFPDLEIIGDMLFSLDFGVVTVADQCSGITCARVLCSIACALSLSCHRISIIPLMVLPLVVVLNNARILTLTLACTHYGRAFALGTGGGMSSFHYGASVFYILVGLGVIWLIMDKPFSAHGRKKQTSTR